MKLVETLNLIKNPLKFDPNKKISKEIILKILEAARWAPSAGNQQLWRFLVINENEKLKFIKEAVKEGDSRLIKRLSEYRDPNEEELNKAGFRFDENFFNFDQDQYHSEIQRIHEIDVLCSQSTSTFIICCHSNWFTGKIFGEIEMGSAILNMILIAKEFNVSVRWFRNFNREYIRDKFRIPKNIEIDAILAFGFPIDEEGFIFVNKINIEDFLSYNTWENPFNVQNNLIELKEGNKYDITTIDAILDRRAIRKFHTEENFNISLSNINKIVYAGLSAPLVFNKPYIKILVIDASNVLSKISNNAKIFFKKQTHLQQVPLIIIVAFRAQNSPAFYAKIEIGAIIQLILLRAYSLKIGTCWIGAFSRKNIKEIIQCPKGWHIGSLIVLGKSKKYPISPGRTNLGKIGFYNEWNKSIVKYQRTIHPKSKALSILMRRILKPHTKTILRNIDAGCKDSSFLISDLD
jgi:nitroreductase